VAAMNLEWRRKDEHYLFCEEDEALAHVGVLDGVTVTTDGETFCVAGIGGVLTRADQRSRGLARRLLAYAIRNLATESRSDFAMLFCLDRLVPYYRGLGWSLLTDGVLAQQAGGHVKSPLNAMVFPLRERTWPGGIVVVLERHF